MRQKRCDQIVDEERQPAHDETAHDDAQRLRGFVLTLHRRDAVRHRFVVSAAVDATRGRCRCRRRLMRMRSNRGRRAAERSRVADANAVMHCLRWCVCNADRLRADDRRRRAGAGRRIWLGMQQDGLLMMGAAMDPTRLRRSTGAADQLVLAVPMMVNRLPTSGVRRRRVPHVQRSALRGR